MCYFTYRAQTNCIYPDFNLILIIGKFTMATIVGDVTGPQHTATTHKIYLILLRRSTAFH